MAQGVVGMCPEQVLAFCSVETAVVARPWCTYQCTEVVVTLAGAGTQGLALLCLQGGEGAIRVALCTLPRSHKARPQSVRLNC